MIKKFTFFLAIIALVFCTTFTTKPKHMVPWAGRFKGTHQPFDLFIETPDADVPTLIFTWYILSGKDTQDDSSRITLFRIHGDKALSTHVRKALENDCPHEMHRSIEGIQLIDLCGSLHNESGFFKRTDQ